MPNHYHLILRPSVDGEMSRFMGCHFRLGGRNAYDALSCSLSHQRAGPCLPTGATRAFQFKMTSTSSLSVGTSSETRCELDLLPKPWIGIGEHYDVGSKQPNQTRSYFRPGRFSGYRTGWLESTNHFPKANWKPFACAPSVVAFGTRWVGGIDREKTQFGINHASAWPSQGPTVA